MYMWDIKEKKKIIHCTHVVFYDKHFTINFFLFVAVTGWTPVWKITKVV